MKTPTSAVSMRIYDIMPRPRQFHWYQVLMLVLQILTEWLIWSQIDAAGWAPHTGFLPLVAIAATVLTALAVWWSREDAMSVYVSVLVAGCALICWQLEPVIRDDVTTSLGADVAARLQGYGDIVSEVALHVVRWWRLTIQGTSAHDTVLFVAALALLCLVVTMITAWLLFRLQLAWVSVSCGAIPLLVNHAFVPQRDDTILMVFVCLAMLIVVVNHISVRQSVWQYMRVDFPATASLRVLWQAIVLLVPVVALAMLLPLPANNERAYAAWQALRTPFATVRTSWETLFGNGGVDVAGGFSQVAVAVAGPRQRSEQAVLRVQTSSTDYLRATTFDWYTGSGWQRRARADTTPMRVGQRIPNRNRAQVTVSSRITLMRPRNDDVLLSVGIPTAYGVDAQTLALHGVDMDSTSLFAVQSDIIQNVDSTYTVTSLLSRANENDLRNAPPAPATINAVYAALPDSLPARVERLAASIVAQAGATTQYDKSLAIQQYLRQLTYDESRTRPPTTSDWVDYFLFESQRGYCDDFATAMVVMLRTQGIPARLVQGYVLADRDPIRGDYVVRESLAHSWVEVYFDGFGWQRFEPTPTGYAQVPDRSAPVAAPTMSPTSATANTMPANTRPTPTRDLAQFEPADGGAGAAPTHTSWWWYAAILLLALGGGIGAGRMWWRSLAPRRRHDLSYQLMVACLQLAGIPVTPSTTPSELAHRGAATLPTVADAIVGICHTSNDIHYAQRTPTTWPVMPWRAFVWACLVYRWQHWRESL